jgi:hypothetical protein
MITNPAFGAIRTIGQKQAMLEQALDNVGIHQAERLPLAKELVEISLIIFSSSNVERSGNEKTATVFKKVLEQASAQV